MRHIFPIGIVADLADIDADPRQVGLVYPDTADISPTQVFCHCDRNECQTALCLFQHPCNCMFIQVNQLCQLFQHRLNAPSGLGLFPHQDNTIVLHIDRQVIPATIHDEASRGADQAKIDAVFLSQHGIAFAFQHLQVIQARTKPPHDQGLPAHKQGRPAGKHFGFGLIRIHYALDPMHPSLEQAPPYGLVITTPPVVDTT